MFKQTKDLAGQQHGFVHEAVKACVRLDCRTATEYRRVSFSLSRDEAYSEAVVSVGNTKVVCVVRGELSQPYPDRPTEGTLQFNAKTSIKAEAAGLAAGDITRALERSLRDSDCLDLESLCVAAGSSAWAVACDLVLVDYDGNAADACILAALAALRAFRRPEVTAVSAVGASGQDAWRAGSYIKVYSAEERDPLPLALHQTPLAVTMSLFKDPLTEREPVAVADPTAAEEAAQSGSIVYTFNAHSELCGMYKSGQGCGMRAASVVAASLVASACAAGMHAEMDSALEALDRRCDLERAQRLEQLRRRRHAQGALSHDRAEAEAQRGGATDGAVGVGGIDRNDPILSYGMVHSEVFTRE